MNGRDYRSINKQGKWPEIETMLVSLGLREGPDRRHGSPSPPRLVLVSCTGEEALVFDVR